MTRKPQSFKPGDEWSSLRLDVSKREAFLRRADVRGTLKLNEWLLDRCTYKAQADDTFGLDPKISKKDTSGELSKHLEQLLRLCAEANGWRVDELNIQPDHVHLVVQFVPTISVSKMVQLFKGRSSRALRKEFPELEEFYWEDSFWADGYFAEIVGRCNLETIRSYVRNQ